ncbi:MAG: PQQ-binding-like beta-propeller repeat protein, partial [Acidobacteriota bacterium]
AGADTVGWRMDGDGRYLDAKPPTSWSTTDSVVWKTAFDTWSNASPVLLEDAGLIITLMEPDEIIAVKASDGTIAWRASTRDVFSKDVKAHKANGWTTATPVSDGRHVFTLFGTGVVAAHDLEGKRVWARHLQQPEHRWGNSASPVLAGGRLIVHVVDLIGLDPATGKEVWRSTSPAKWGSPVVTRIADTDVVITPAGDVFKAVSGSRLSSEIGSVEFSTPVVQDGHVYFIEKKATAVRLPKALDQPFETLWTGRLQGSRHYASPVIHDGLIYAVSREQKFSILDAESGELLHERQLDLDPEGGSNSAYPSITLAGNKIFVSTQNGTTAVLEPGREYQELARNSIEGFRSTPVFDGERMYLRAFDHLYCFGSGEGAAAAGP